MYRNPKEQILAYAELQCGCSTQNSFLSFNFRSLHEIKSINSSKGLKEFQYLTSHRYALHYVVREKVLALCFSGEQPANVSCYVHDFILLLSQLFSPFHPLPSAPELKIPYFCLFQWLIFGYNWLKQKVKASPCFLSPPLPVLVSENSFWKYQVLIRDAKGNTSSSCLTQAFVYTCKVFVGLRIPLGHME